MAVLIRNRETEERIRLLAARTGKSLTEAVDEAVSARLASTPRPKEDFETRLARIKAATAEFDRTRPPVVDPRPLDELLADDDSGEPYR